MRVLLDHNVPHKLRGSLAGLGNHEIVTASYLGWGELKNGELLQAAEKDGFDVFVTADQGIAYEQNLAARRLALVALSTNNWPVLKDHIPKVLAPIESAAPGSLQVVDCGAFNRKSISSA